MKVVAQKAETLLQRHHPALHGMRFQAHLAKYPLNMIHDPSSRSLRAAEDNEIIRIPDHPVPPFRHLPVQGMEIDVCQQGADYSTLRRAFLRLVPDATFHDARLQKHPDEPEHRPIADFFRNRVDEPVMGYVVKVSHHVAIDYVLETGLQVCGNLVDGIVRASSGPKTKAAGQKLALEDGLDDHPRRLLNHPVPDRGYAQWPLTPVRFGDIPRLTGCGR
jgi:hypothetical protein